MENTLKSISVYKLTVYRAVFFILIGCIIFSCTNTQKTDDNKEKDDAKMSEGTPNADVAVPNESNDMFVVNAAEINLEEIKLGQLAQQKGKMKDVKELGKMMEESHTKALNELTALAQKKSITIPTTPPEKAEAAYKDLNSKSGMEFDKAYATMMVDGHKDAIAKFEKASTESSDADIKEWATKMLPELKMHLDHSMDCQNKHNK